MEYFDAAQVGAWLQATGRGNNSDAAQDYAAYASPSYDPLQVPFKSVLAMIALRSIVGSPLGEVTLEDLLDRADECDPDDEILYAEISGVGDACGVLARYVDSLVESAYSEAAAFERVFEKRFRVDEREVGDTALSPTGLEVMTRTANAFAGLMQTDPAIVDASGNCGDVIVALNADENLAREFTILATSRDHRMARLLRQRLTVHHIPYAGLSVQDDGTFNVPGPALHLAQFAGSPGQVVSPTDILSAIENISLQMGAGHVAIVMAPSAALSDALSDRQAESLRSEILRSGRVRMIVRLPLGLRPRSPQQAQTIWILGDPQQEIELAQRWTMVADLAAIDLDSDAIEELVSDFVASLGDLSAVRAHAFRFGRLVRIGGLLATRRSLVLASHSAQSGAAVLTGAALAVRVEELLRALDAHTPGADLRKIEVELASADSLIRASSVDELIARGHLRYVPGNRIDRDDVIFGGPEFGSIRLVGPPEITGGAPLGNRRIDRLRFAADYSVGRVTEPGDVIFITAPRPTALLDRDGTSIAEFPARILRIAPSDPGGLVGDLIVSDISELPPLNKDWRRWTLRRTDPVQRGALADTLTIIRMGQEEGRRRLAILDELSHLLMSGVAARKIVLTEPSDLPAHLEGTN